LPHTGPRVAPTSSRGGGPEPEDWRRARGEGVGSVGTGAVGPGRATRPAMPHDRWSGEDPPARGRRRISLEEGRPPGRPSSRLPHTGPRVAASTLGRHGTDQLPRRRPRARRPAARSGRCRPTLGARRRRPGEGVGSIGTGAVGPGARRPPAVGPAGSPGPPGAGWGRAPAGWPLDRWPGEGAPGPAGRHDPLGPLDPPGGHDPPGRGPAWWSRRRSPATWPAGRWFGPHGPRFRPHGASQRRRRRWQRPEAPGRRRGRRAGGPVPAAAAAGPAAGG
jgi:hypothetical protein